MNVPMTKVNTKCTLQHYCIIHLQAQNVSTYNSVVLYGGCNIAMRLKQDFRNRNLKEN
jgi:hypothetical protein